MSGGGVRPTAEKMAEIRRYAAVFPWATVNLVLAELDAVTAERDATRAMVEDCRDIMNRMGDAASEGLMALPKCMDRVEFVRECVSMQRDRGADEAFVNVQSLGRPR